MPDARFHISGHQGLTAGSLAHRLFPALPVNAQPRLNPFPFSHLFINTELRGGAGYGSVSFDGAGSGRYDFSVGWQLRIRTSPGARVSIKDKAGAEVFSGEIPSDGEISVPLIQYVQERDGETMLTPHTVTVSRRGRTVARDVTMDRNRTIMVAP